jgi:PTH1 family peptidyl-tRNA hydrolase
MLLLVGLGNPGPSYRDNRHNVGFMAVDAIHGRWRLGPYRSKFHGDLADGVIAGEKVLILKPQTYMNESGRAVQAAMTFYKIAPGDVVVLHDELDLAAGKLRVKRGGGHAGHNGLRSIQGHVGPDFRRVRIGVGHPGDKDKVVGHVLKDFSKEDQTWLEPMLDGIAGAADLLIKGDDAGFQNKVALAVKPPRPNTKRPDDGGSTEEKKD